MTRHRIAIAALAWILGVAIGHAALPPGISGSWYNPAQSGHGLTIEILDRSRALGAWYVYDAAGNPIHLYLEGTIVGTTIESNAYLARGMRFGSFNSSENRVQPWGKVTIAFSGCDSATLRWNADAVAGAGYGSGEMPLTRLTRIAGLKCDFPSTQGLLPAGTYSGSWDRAAGGQGTRPYLLYGAVDTQGRLWAAPQWTPGASYVSTVAPPPTFFGIDAAAVDDRVVMQMDVRYGVSFSHDGRGPGIAFPISFTVAADGSVATAVRTSLQSTLVERFEIGHDASVNDPMRQEGFDPATLAGRQFVFLAHQQFFGAWNMDLVFLDGQRFCIPLNIQGIDTPCAFAGRIGAVDPGLAMFDIEIADTRAGGTTSVGKAWLTGSPRRLVIVAHDGRDGLSLIAAER